MRRAQLVVDNPNLIAWDEKDAKAQLNRTGLMFRVECPGWRQMEGVGLLLDGASRKIRGEASTGMVAGRRFCDNW